MFKKLIKRLFQSQKKSNNTNYFYFEDSKKTAKNIEDQHNKEIRKKDVTLFKAESIEDIQQSTFFDFLFGKSNNNGSQDELSVHIAKNIKKLLENPKHILASLPVLPLSITKVLQQLNDEEFETDVVINLIEQEPVVAAKVLELANSQYYNPSDKAVVDLKSAFMRLGRNGLIEGVINGFISKLTPQSQVYFKQYGNKIWEHSAATGNIAKQLISNSEHKELAAQAYFIGLISNLGNMIIFQLLMDAFSYVHPDCQPNSAAFKVLIHKNAKKITYFIAKYWQFPKPILDALAIQTKIQSSSVLNTAINKYPLGGYIYEANIISQLTMMFEQDFIDINTLAEAKVNLLVSHESKKIIEQIVKCALEKH